MDTDIDSFVPQEFFKKEPALLYHYTTKEGFRGILKTKHLWATHILFQNDSQEFKLAFSVLQQVIEENKYFDKDWHRLTADQFKGVRIFTASFSENFNIVDQWFNYANSNPGYCIGFKTKKLIQFIDKESETEVENKETSMQSIPRSPWPVFKYKFCKCLYDIDEQKLFFKKTIENILETEKIINTAQNKVYELLLNYAPLFKEKKYKKEEEWRFIITDVKDKEKMKERIGKDFFIPYFELNFVNPDCIGDIYIGYCPDLDKERLLDSTYYICYLYGKSFPSKSDEKIYFIDDVMGKINAHSN